MVKARETQYSTQYTLHTLFITCVHYVCVCERETLNGIHKKTADSASTVKRGIRLLTVTSLANVIILLLQLYIDFSGAAANNGRPKIRSQGYLCPSEAPTGRRGSGGGSGGGRSVTDQTPSAVLGMQESHAASLLGWCLNLPPPPKHTHTHTRIHTHTHHTHTTHTRTHTHSHTPYPFV